MTKAIATSRRSFFRKCVLPAAMASAAILAATSAKAAPDTWSGTSSADWNTGGNWSGGVPTATSAATFSNNVNTNVTLSGTGTTQSVTFTGAGTGAFTIGTTGGPSLVLATGGAISTDTTILNTETVNAPLVIGATSTAATYSFTSGATSATNTLVIGGAIQGAASTGTTVLTLNGTNTGANTVSGAITDGSAGGLVGITKSGAGTWVVSGNNSYTGGTTVSAGVLTLSGSNSGVGTTTLTAGTLNVNNANALESGLFTITAGTLDNTSGAAITLANNPTITWGVSAFAFSTSAGTAANSLNLGTGAVNLNDTVGRAITLNGTGSLTFGGVMTNTAAGNANFSVNNGVGTSSTSAVDILGGFVLSGTASTARSDTIGGSGNINISGAVTDVSSGTAASALTYSGTGTLALSGNNTYTGTTTLNAISNTQIGTLILSGSNAANSAGLVLTSGRLDVNSTNALGSGTLTISPSGYSIIDNTSGSAKVEANASPILLGSTTAAGNFAFGGTNNLTLTGTATMFSSQVIGLNGTATLTLGGLNFSASSGGQTLTVDGTGNTLNINTMTLLASGASISLNGNGNISTGTILNNGAASTLTYSGSGTLSIGGTSNTITGGVNLNSGGLNLTGSITPGVTVSAGNFNESGTGVIGGAASALSVKGGAATVSGLNTYGGGTSVTGGTLTVDFSGATTPASASNILTSGSALTLGNGKLVIKGGGTGDTNSQTLGAVTFNTGSSSSIVFNQNGDTSLNATLGALSRSAAATTDFTLPTAGSVTTTSTTFATNGIATSAAGASGIAFATANGGTTWLTNTAGTLGALGTYSTGNANYTSTKNVDVTNGDGPTAGSGANSLRFNAQNIGLTLVGTNAITSGGILVTPGSTGTITGGQLTSGAGSNKELVIFDYGTLNVNSVISDNSTPVAVTLAGTGTTTFSNANNSYTGATSVTAGTLILAGGSTSAGATTVYTGGTLQLASPTAQDGGLASGTLTLSGGTLQATSAAPLTVANTVTLAGSSMVSGGQSLTLSNLNQSSSTTLTNNIAAGQTLTLSDVNINSSATTALTLTMNGTGNTTIASLNDFGNAVSTGHGGLFTYSGSGTVNLTGVNTYSGTTGILGGTVILSGTNTAAASGVSFVIGGVGGTFALDNTGATAAKVQTFGALAIQGGEDVIQISHSANFDELGSFASLGARSAGATENFVVNGTNSATNGFTFAAQTAGFLNQGAFFNGSNYAWYSAAGTAGIVRALNYASDTGALTTSGGATTGTVGVGGGTALYVQTTGAVTSQITQAVTTLNLAGTGTVSGQNDMTLASGAILSTKGILRSGNVAGSEATISGGAGISGSSGADLVIRTDGVNDVLDINTSIIGGATSTNAGIVKSGAGTLILGPNAVNTYLVGTTIDAGTLNVSQDSNLGLSFDTISINSGTLQAGASFNINSSRVINLAAAGAGATIDTQSNNLGILGSIAGGGVTQTLTKTGSGTLTLSGNNTYLDATAINGGTLNVTGATALSSAVSVNTGATLQVSGSVGGTVAVANGATLSGTGSTGAASIAGGGSINLRDGAIGTLTVGGLSSGSTGTASSFSFDIQTVSGVTSVDKILDTSTLSLAGLNGTTISIGNIAGSTTLVNGSYAIITYTGLQQTLADLSLSTTSLDSKTLSLTQTGDTIYLNIASASSSTNGQYTLTTTAGSLNVHASVGTTLGTTSLATTIANTGTGTQDALNYSGITATSTSGSVGAATGTTSGTNLALGANNSPGATQTFTAGTTAGNVTISNTGSVTNATDTAETPVGTNTGVTINVYSGQSTWSKNGGGSWATTGTGSFGAGANWGANQGAPGITAGFTNTDSATFDNSVLTAGSSATVTLDGASPSLNAMTFNTQAGSGYTIAQGSGGSLALAGNGGNATVTVTSGTHVISAPVSLTTSANVNVASGQAITFSGALSGSGKLNNIGGGTTTLSGSNSYTGGTSATAGTLLLTNTAGSATGTGALTVGAGATLGGTGTSSGTSFNISGTGTSTRANILVGLTSAAGISTSSVLTLQGTSASTIADANLTFNLDAKSTASTQLNVGATNVAFGTDAKGSVLFTLNLQNEPAIVGNGTMYTLIAGTGITSTAPGASTGQYTGLTLGTSTTVGGVTQTIITGNNLQLAFGSSIDNSYYANGSYLVLYQSSGVDDIDVVVVPEPSTWAMLLGGAGLLFFVLRRRRQA